MTSATLSHWFSFGDCCISLSERRPASGRPRGTLVFLHGRFGSGGIWSRVSESLAGQFRCVSMDFPGFGQSFSVRGRGMSLLESADLVSGVVGRLAKEAVVLVGHDIGGAIAQLCSIYHPEKLAALVLINSPSLGLPIRSVSGGAWSLRWRLWRMIREAALEPEHEDMIRQQYGRGESRRSALSAIARAQSSWPGVAERRVLRGAMTGFERPTLLLWGSRDELTPLDHGFELMRTFPDASLYQSGRCGHWPCMEDPEWVTGKMTDFLFRAFTPARRSLSR